MRCFPLVPLLFVLSCSNGVAKLSFLYSSSCCNRMKAHLSPTSLIKVLCRSFAQPLSFLRHISLHLHSSPYFELRSIIWPLQYNSYTGYVCSDTLKSISNQSRTHCRARSLSPFMAILSMVCIAVLLSAPWLHYVGMFCNLHVCQYR